MKNLLAFSRQDRQTHSPARMQDIAAATLSLVRALFSRDQIAVEADIPADLPTFKCRSQQIQQVLLNLLTNARDATNERYPESDPEKRVRIETRLLERDGRRWLRTTVADFGNGIPAELRERIFDPFFTTKPQGAGDGARPLRLLRDRPGPPRGADVRERAGRRDPVLPRSPRGQRLDPRGRRLDPARTAVMARVLVVDDEPSIRETLAEFLADEGHAVSTAESVAEATALLDRGELDVIVSDIILPQASGIELLRLPQREGAAREGRADHRGAQLRDRGRGRAARRLRLPAQAGHPGGDLPRRRLRGARQGDRGREPALPREARADRRRSAPSRIRSTPSVCGRSRTAPAAWSSARASESWPPAC